jgi:hypothetical protein
MDSTDKPFIYTGQSSRDIPRYVRHVKVDPAVKEIGERAFCNCHQLVSVELNEGLERIEYEAFTDCTSLRSIVIPSTVKEIRRGAFHECEQLWNVELREGLKWIGRAAFEGCRSLRRIRIPSTVKDIGVMAFGKEAFSGSFHGCHRLRNVELCEGLERIDEGAFAYCKSLTSITIPSTIKEIGEKAFSGCEQLVNVELNEGLEEIRRLAFWCCRSLTSIRIPSTVGGIGMQAFGNCNQLMNIELCEGLRGIEYVAFADCTSLQSIVIPSTVKQIADNAFKDCDSLEAIEFCDEIEQLVNEATLTWWNQGVSEVSLRTYSFLAEDNIPARLGTLKVRVWKKNIHNLLQRIPEKLQNNDSSNDSDDDSYESDDDEEINDYFDSIESRLAYYIYLQEIAPFLELALWKVKLTEQQSNGNLIDDDTKMLCRIDSISMFAIIFPNVLSFLSVDAE